MTTAWPRGFVLAFCALSACVSFETFVERDASIDLTPDACRNGVQDADELGVDCGGPCAACEVPPLPCDPCVEVPTPCTPETDAAFCARVAATCGAVSGTDNCGAVRAVTSCGDCIVHPSVSCVANVCACSLTPETDAELCEASQRSCGSFNVTDRCGTVRTPVCGPCLGGRACQPNGDCTPVCPTLPLSQGIFEGERIWSYDAAAAPRWLRIDNTRGILHAATSDLSTAFIEFARNPLTNTVSVCDVAGNERLFFFVDFVGGAYRFSLVGTKADMLAAGFGLVGDQSFALTSDGNTLIGMNADRTAFLQRTRSSAHGAPNVTWAQPAAAFGVIGGTGLSNPVMAPGDSLFFYVATPVATPLQMRSTRLGDGSYSTGVDVTAEFTTDEKLHFVESLSPDLLTAFATHYGAGGLTRVFSRANRWGTFGAVGTTGDFVNGFRTRVNASCSAVLTTCEGGCANERVCLMPLRDCVPETDQAMCTRLGADCAVTAQDLCYRERTINCGTCTGSMVCSRGGRCSDPTPPVLSIFTPNMPTPDPDGVYEVKLYQPQPGGGDALIDERFFLLGATADMQTLLVYRGCDAASAEYYFADRFHPTNYRYRLTRIATGTELSASGLAVGDAVMGLSADGRSLISANATRTGFVTWTRPGTAMSLSFTPEAVRVLNGFVGVSAGQDIGFPSVSADGRFFVHTLESPTRRVFIVESTVGGFFRGPVVEITSALTDAEVVPTTYAPTGISPDGLTLFTTNGTDTFLFSRATLSAAFEAYGSPEPFGGKFSRPTYFGGAGTVGGKLFSMRAGATCEDERIVVNGIGPDI